MASRKFNPAFFTVMNVMRDHNDPNAFIFHIIGQPAFDGPLPLLLIHIYEQRNRIAERKCLHLQCPLSFTEAEIREKQQREQEWASVYGEFERLLANVAGKDGWVSHGEYKEAMPCVSQAPWKPQTLV
ncbi:hypothetical protein ACJ73_01266 [Blastomyces percursus]|uniref:Uncharacterized protein n=1 Tax=Blastomyces percursus TaxID=1658174 RepID=A0A1J9RFI3_9EURO|nr:hypothetical protein ACJ73_01266 [Blastomyces percursus]